MIRSIVRVFVAASVASAIAACSSSSTPGGGADAGLSGGGAGGKGGKGGGPSGSGGEPVGPACTTADAGHDNCRLCLARYCCSDLTECLGETLCSGALDTHEKCFNTPGEETSTCFGNLTRELQGDAGQAAGLGAIPICIIMNCSMACGGPGVV